MCLYCAIQGFRNQDYTLDKRSWIIAFLFPLAALTLLVGPAFRALQDFGLTLKAFEVEEVREMSGVLIAGAWMLFNAFQANLQEHMEPDKLVTDKLLGRHNSMAETVKESVALAVPVGLFAVWWIWRSTVNDGGVAVAEHCKGMLG
jgi:hypothetical protein